MRTHLRLAVGLLVTIAFLGTSCSSAGTTATSSDGATTEPAAGGSTPGAAGSSAAGSITVSAAASLTAPFEQIGDEFEKANPAVTDVTFNFDSSATLVTQIQGGAPADSFASADEANMTTLTDADLVVGTPTVFARNRLTIVVKDGNPKAVTSLADLATVGTVSLCGRDVPCGRYADQILQQAGVTIPTDRVTRGQNVKATLSAVSDGDADAAIVYVTDANDKVDTVAIPDAQNVIATYPIAVLTTSTNPATAEAFIAFVLGPRGQATLRAAGFLPPT